jgi:hypothetical protein
MPYLRAEERVNVNTLTCPITAGQLNYSVTRLCERFRGEKGDSYDTFNAIIGALECAKQEYYRRIVADYEAIKKEQNGDVYRPVRG